jgi:plasmid segregation protein ParM
MQEYVGNSNNTMQKVLIAVDNGFDSTKVYCVLNNKEYKFKFNSKFEKVIFEDDLNKNNTFKLYYNNTVYLVGEGATYSNLNNDKYNSDLHKICTYTALSKISNFIGYEFDLVVGYPLNICSYNKDIFSKYLKNNDEVIITELDNELKRFKINDVIVLPQGAVSPYSQDINKFKDKIIGVIDIGGKTINGIILDNLNPIRETMFTEDLGILILYDDIKIKLNSRGYNVMDYQISDIVKNGLIGYDKNEIKTIIDEVIDEHISKIKLVMRKRKWAIETLEILCIGGGSIVLKDYIYKILPYGIICDDADYVNVKSFYNVGKIYYGY